MPSKAKFTNPSPTDLLYPLKSISLLLTLRFSSCGTFRLFSGLRRLFGLLGLLAAFMLFGGLHWLLRLLGLLAAFRLFGGLFGLLALLGLHGLLALLGQELHQIKTKLEMNICNVYVSTRSVYGHVHVSSRVSGGVHKLCTTRRGHPKSLLGVNK
jgi:hypothetical protein